MARTEPPSPRTIARARRTGNVPHTPALTGAAALVALAIALTVSASSLVVGVTRLSRTAWDSLRVPGGPQTGLLDAATSLMVSVAAVMLTAWIAAIATGLLQTRFNLTTPFVRGTLLRPRLPGPGELARRALGLLVGLALAVLAVVWLLDAVPWFGAHVGDAPEHVGRGLIAGAGRLLATLTALVVVGAVLDAVVRRRQWWMSLHRSRREAQREARSAELSPELRRALRTRARQAQQARQVDAGQIVAWITDPLTRRATAIAWAPPVLDPPHIAEQCAEATFTAAVQRARTAGVAVIAAPVLARRLVRLEIGHPIPEGLFDEVASVFASHHIDASTASRPSSSANIPGTAARKR